MPPGNASFLVRSPVRHLAIPTAVQNQPAEAARGQMAKPKATLTHRWGYAEAASVEESRKRRSDRNMLRYTEERQRLRIDKPLAMSTFCTRAKLDDYPGHCFPNPGKYRRTSHGNKLEDYFLPTDSSGPLMDKLKTTACRRVIPIWMIQDRGYSQASEEHGLHGRQTFVADMPCRVR